MDPVRELLAPDGPRQVPPRVLGHDAALAVGVADLVEPIADQRAHRQEVVGDLFGLLGFGIVVEKSVVLVGEESLLLAAFAPESQEGEAHRWRTELLDGHVDQLLHHRVGDARHDAVDVPGVGAGIDDGLDQRGQAVVSLDDVRAGPSARRIESVMITDEDCW